MVIDGLPLQTYATAIFSGVGALVMLAFRRANDALAVSGVLIFAISLTSLSGAPVGEISVIRLWSTLRAGAIVSGVSFSWQSVQTEDEPAH